LSWLFQELVRYPRPSGMSLAQVGVMVRNRLGRALGLTLMLLGIALGWAVLDSMARAVAGALVRPVAAGMVPVDGRVPAARVLWAQLRAGRGGMAARAPPVVRQRLLPAILALGRGGFLLVALDVLAHARFDTGHGLHVAALA